MTEEIVVRQIDVVLTKLSLQPGDVLVVSIPQGSRPKHDWIARIRRAFEESLGVPTMVLADGIKLEAVLSVALPFLSHAADLRMKAAEEFRERLEKMVEAKA